MNLLPAAVAAVGAALLILQWTHGRMFWLDEEMIAINVRDRSFGELAARLALGQAAPYGWLVAQRAILIAAGSGERALRFLPMAFGVATLATALWTGRRWLSLAGAVALVFLCAFGQWLSFHALEMKHYSADACFGLLLPALAVWASEAPPAQFQRRTTIWWSVAAVSQWMSNGALFVAPSSAAVLIAVAARRFGGRVAVRAAAPALIWASSLALNFVIALGPARSSDYLQRYWQWAFPPAAAGAAQTFRWLGAQLAPLAIKPGGSGFVVGFWTAAAIGFGFGRARSSPAVFASAFALVPVAAFTWAGLRLVPLSERLTLWMVPAVYVGIAMALDLTLTLLTIGGRQRRIVRTAIAAAATATLVAFFADVYRRGLTYLNLTPPPDNHELDDRGAVTWLARQQQQGDVWITTHNALPAVWWYANPGERVPLVEASLMSPEAACGDQEVTLWLRSQGHRRALVYFGFGHDSAPDLDAALLAGLGEIGHVVGYRRFSILSHAVVIELDHRSAGAVTLGRLSGERDSRSMSRATDCVRIEPARQW